MEKKEIVRFMLQTQRAMTRQYMILLAFGEKFTAKNIGSYRDNRLVIFKRANGAEVKKILKMTIEKF